MKVLTVMRNDKYRLRFSSPNKQEDECKTLSIVVMNCSDIFCWVVYRNYSYRRHNIGLSTDQLRLNEAKQKAQRRLAVKYARLLVFALNNMLISPKKVSEKQISLPYLNSVLTQLNIWTYAKE